VYASKSHLAAIILIVFVAIGKAHGQNGSSSACTVAYYTKDSVAIKMPGFRMWFDSIQHIQTRKQIVQQKAFLATDKMLMAEPDSGAVVGPKQQSEYNAAKKESESINKQIDKYDEQIILLTVTHLMPYYDSLARIASRISKQQDMADVFEIGENRPMICPNDQVLMVDITNDIARSVGVKPVLLRVGVYNSDSLLRSLPGYSVLADSAVAERKILDAELEKMDAEITRMQHELDSLQPSLSKRAIQAREEKIAEKKDLRAIHSAYETYKLEERDSVRTVSYRRKLRSAVVIAAREYHCIKYYDKAIAQNYWTSKEAEFIDLNTGIAPKMR